jgi:hypothetical protein
MSTPIRAARSVALVVVLGAALVACALPGQQAPSQPSGTADETPLANQSYPGPGTATVALPTGTTNQTPAAGTAVPGTAVPGTQAPGTAATATPPATGSSATPAPGAAGLLGPEWTVAYSGDFNLDGRADAIGWIPAAGVTKGPTFNQAQYANYTGPASQLVIVHGGPDGRPQVRFVGTTAGLTADNLSLVSFDAARRPAAFMVQVNPRGVPSLLDLLQINASGEPFAQGIGIRWNTASQAYRIVGPGGK